MDLISKQYSLTSKEVFAILLRNHFIFYRLFYYILFAIEVILISKEEWHQKDILVLCIPIVVPIGMIYWVWVSSRNTSLTIKRVTNLEVNEKQFEMSDEEGNSSVILWSFIKSFKKHGNCYTFYLKNGAMIFIPQRILNREEDAQLIRWADEISTKEITL